MRLQRDTNKVRRFQSGGPMLNLATYTPMGIPNVSGASYAASQEVSTSSSDDDNNVGFTQKDIADLLKKMLPSDSKIVMGQMSSLMRDIRAAELDPFVAQQIGGSIANKYLQVRQLADTANQNYEMFNKAKSAIMEKSSLGEYAQDRNGNLYYQKEDGSIGRVSMDDELKDKRLLTYGDLLSYRRLAINGAFNDELIEASEQATSSKDVLATIELVFSKLQSDSEEMQYYVNKQSGRSQVMDTVEGLGAVMSDATDGLYSVTDKSTGISDAKKKTALKTVIRMMPRNQQNFINLRAKLSGVSPEVALYDMIMLRDKRDTSRRISQLRDYEEEAAKAAAKKSGKSGDGGSNGIKTDMTNQHWMLEGMGAKNMRVINNGANSNYAYYGLANTLALGLEPDKKTGFVNVSELTDKKYGMAGLNWSQASFAGANVPFYDLKSFVMNDTQFDIISLPYKEVNGSKIPDFARLSELQEASDLLRALHINDVNASNYNQVNDEMSKRGINIRYDNKGNVITPGYAQFVAFSVATGYNTVENLKDVNLDLFDRVDDDNIAARVAEATGVEADNAAWFGDDSVATGVLYVPYTPNAQLMLTNTESPIQTELNTGDPAQLMMMDRRQNRAAYVATNDELQNMLYQNQ